ncbi:MAG TPA: ABC transporter permease [Puia sp.]|jgi:putative ABC transport system permease protein|nr:ABC transporter permease [Puia sp.]
MLKSFLQIAIRTIRRNSFYSLLNITGLAIGLAIGVMILLWVKDERSFDNFHHNAAEIYKINSHLGTGADARIWGGSPSPLAVYARNSVPEVAKAVRVSGRWNEFLTTYATKTFLESNTAFVDPDFFTVFDFPLLEGNRNHPFTDDHSIVITQSVARKYFGNTDPMGKTLVFDKKVNFTVTAVLADFPANSSINYDIIFPMDLKAHTFTGNGDWKTIDEDLGNFLYTIYIQLKPTASPAAVESKLSAIYRDKKGPDGKTDFFTLQPLSSLHLITADGNTSALSIVRIFTAVAILILIIAGINYVNLSTARSMLRSKEVSVRKIIGAGRPQLFFQFVTESALLFLFASFLAFGLILLLLPLYNNLAAKQLVFSLKDPGVWLVIGCTIAATLAAASIYPALLLSAFRPIDALKGKIASLGVSNAGFRKILVVTQFACSVGLIISTVVIRDQLRYIREKNLGFDQSQVFSVAMRDGMHSHYKAITNELRRLPAVQSLAATESSLVGLNGETGDTWWEGKDPSKMFLINTGYVDEHFIPTLKMQLAAGSNFTGSPADSTHYILNETAVKAMGMKNPVGKPFSLHDVRGTIIGVVKDFNFASLKEAVQPLILSYDSAAWRLYIRTNPGQAADAIAAVRHFWQQYDGAYPFSYSFLDDDFDKLYRADQRVGTLFNVFALVAIIISCLGLFGLATYSAQIRTKEIGIRRVLGASVANVTSLLAKDFIALILLAFLIAAPVAGYLMSGWLRNYAYRTQLTVGIFAGTALIILALALLTICTQAIRAALANPIKSLRTE